MADTDTVATLDPETELEEELAPDDDDQETEALDSAETEEDDDSPETETFTAEDIEAAVKDAEERIRAEAQQAAEEAAYKQQQAKNQEWLNEVAEQQLRNLAYWGAKQAAEGKDPEQVPQMVQRIHLQKQIDGLKAFVFSSAFDDIAGHFDGFLSKEYPDYKPENALQSEYTREVASRDADRAFRALYKKMKAAIEADVVPKRLAEKEKAAAERNKKGAEVANLRKPAATKGPLKGGGGTARGTDLSSYSMEELVKLEEEGKLDSLILASQKRKSP